jgi:hypothetical protein
MAGWRQGTGVHAVYCGRSLLKMRWYYKGTSQASCEDKVDRICLGSCSLQDFGVCNTEPLGSAKREVVQVCVVGKVQ